MTVEETRFGHKCTVLSRLVSYIGAGEMKVMSFERNFKNIF